MQVKPGGLFLNNADVLLGDTGDTRTPTVQHAVVESEATASADDYGYEAALRTPRPQVSQRGQVPHVHPTVEVEPGHLHISNIAASLFGETGLPMPAVQDAVVAEQATGNCCDCDLKVTAVHTPLEASQQEHGVHPTPHLGIAYGPVYNGPHPAQGLPDGPPPHDPIGQRPPRRDRSPTAAWIQYSPAPPQAYQQPSFPIQACCCGPGPNSGAATSQDIDMTRGDLGAAVAGNGAGAAVGCSVHVWDKEDGASFNGLQNPRHAHVQNERVRRARLRDSWAPLRQVVPRLSESSDNATVCERVVEYTRHRQRLSATTSGPEATNGVVQAFLK